MTRTRSRLGVAIGAVLAAAIATSACSSGTATTAAHSPVTITFWGTYGNGGNTAQTSVLNTQLIPAFEKANPDVKVKYVDIPYDSLLQKLTTGAAGGQLPDVLRSDIAWVPQFAALGVFSRLDGTMPNFDTLSRATYPGSLATAAWHGHYFGLPLDTNTRVQISNQQALASAGVTTPPATFADLRADAPKLAAKKISVFADGGLQGWNILPWIWSGGGQITDPGLTRASGYLNSAQNVATIQMLVDLYKQGAIPNLLIGNKGAVSTSDGLPKGKYATILDGPWMTGVWSAQYASFKPVYSPVPAGSGGSVSVVGGEDIVLMSSSKQQAADEKFLAFTQSPTWQLAMAKTGQMAVVSADAAQEATDSPGLAPFIKQLATARSRPAVPAEPKIDTVLQDDLTPAFTGKSTVQAALDKAAAAIDPLLTATH